LSPDLSDAFTRKLYGTFVSYFDADNLDYALEQKRDARGALAEFIKSPHVGQIFISRTKPGITRGNHYHHTKAEKFMVIEGEAIIRLRQIRGQRTEDRGQRTEGRDQRSEVNGQRTEGGDQKADIIEYHVRGEDFRVVDIPPGYTHSIENVGQGELITLFWSSEVLDPQRPDTYALPVQ
jgi:UDP-2-acetamido-2,6-beta-L-arabino-hexul-4-ose reductase